MRARVALVGIALAVAAVAGVCFRTYERDERVTAFYADPEQRLRAGVLAGLAEAEASAELDAQGIACRPPAAPERLVCRSGHVAPGRLIGAELVGSLELDAGGRVVRTPVHRFNTRVRPRHARHGARPPIWYTEERRTHMSRVSTTGGER